VYEESALHSKLVSIFPSDCVRSKKGWTSSRPKKRSLPSRPRANWVAEDLAAEEIAPASQRGLRVFVSWSGERSRALAQALRAWLPLVLHFVEPWLSDADVEPGQRWGDAIAKELEASNFGIICVTRESAAAPWMLFEAGALAKSLDGSKVIPRLLDLEFKEISGPLAQFQAKKVERQGLLEVIQCINDAAIAPISHDRLGQLFEALWPNFEAEYTKIPNLQSPTKHSRPQSDVLEELVSGVRSLDLRLRDGFDGQNEKWPRRSRRKIVIAREIADRLSQRIEPKIGLLVLASLLKDDAPWIYELAAEAVRTRPFPRGSDRSFRALRDALDFSIHNGFADERTGGLEVIHLIRRHLELIDMSIKHLDASGLQSVKDAPTHSDSQRREPPKLEKVEE
jgi:hypothetical protein